MGTTVVGERGQIVIPKEIRDELGLRPGTQLIIMHHGADAPVIIMPVHHVKKMIDKMTAGFRKVRKML